MKNLAHSASLHAEENSAPSKPGIKQLGHEAIPHHDQRDGLDAAAFDALGAAVDRVTAAAGLARAVVDYVPREGEFGKLDCLDAIELHLLRPAAAELRNAYEACEPSA
jgi:hypothetical protein